MVGAVERNSVTTLQGSLAQTHHQMRIGVLERHEERCVVDAMEKSGATVSEREAESGATWGALRDGRRERSGATALTGSVYPDPPCRSEKRGLEQRVGRCEVGEMERSGATALRGSYTQILDLGARIGVWNDTAR